jgi:hypothetical protein
MVDALMKLSISDLQKLDLAPYLSTITPSTKSILNKLAAYDNNVTHLLSVH